MQSQVRFNRSRFQRRVPGGFGAEPGQVQQRSGEGSGEGSEKVWEASVQSEVKFRAGLGGFGEEAGQRRFQEALVQSQVRFNGFRFWRRPGRLGCRAVSEKVPEKVWEVLVQRQVRFNRVLEKEVSEKVPGGFVQRQVRFNGSGEGLGGFGAG